MLIFIIKYSDGWRRNHTIQTEALNEDMALARLMLALPTAVVHSVEPMGEQE